MQILVTVNNPSKTSQSKKVPAINVKKTNSRAGPDRAVTKAPAVQSTQKNDALNGMKIQMY
jgi:hypothetical protein